MRQSASRHADDGSGARLVQEPVDGFDVGLAIEAADARSSRTVEMPRRAMAAASLIPLQMLEGHRLGDYHEAEMAVAEVVEQVGASKARPPSASSQLHRRPGGGRATKGNSARAGRRCAVGLGDVVDHYAVGASGSDHVTQDQSSADPAGGGDDWSLPRDTNPLKPGDELLRKESTRLGPRMGRNEADLPSGLEIRSVRGKGRVIGAGCLMMRCRSLIRPARDQRRAPW
jgi:hypothetical protein